MIVWVEDMGTSWYGHTFSVSTEWQDGILYKADSAKEAVEAFEKDRHCKVTAIREGIK